MVGAILECCPTVATPLAEAFGDLPRRTLPAVPPLLRKDTDVEAVLSSIGQHLVRREIEAGPEWGEDEGLRRRILTLLTRHCVAQQRDDVVERVLRAMRG